MLELEALAETIGMYDRQVIEDVFLEQLLVDVRDLRASEEEIDHTDGRQQILVIVSPMSSVERHFESIPRRKLV